MQITKRYRANVSTNAKGVKQPDVTVEITAQTTSPEEVIDSKILEDEVMADLTSIEERLSIEYPVKKE